MSRILNEKPSEKQMKEAYEELQRCYKLRGSFPYMGGTNVMDVPLDIALSQMIERVNEDVNFKTNQIERLRKMEDDVDAMRRLLFQPYRTG